MTDERHEQELGRCTIVVTCAVFRRTHSGLETLILKRSETEGEGPGLWTVPGGKLQLCDLGEKVSGASSHNVWMDVLNRAILREIREETGILEREIHPILLPSREKIFIRKDGTPTLVFVFWTLSYYGTEVRLGEGATEHRWVREGELDGYTFIGNVKDDIRAAFQAFWESERELNRPFTCEKD
ncbi:MAG: NUDIX domain-containing protein [bacterium]|nr:NUDIX domain-containing protein [bacterium]